MQATNSQIMDKFELHLDEMIVKIQNCQTDKEFMSCSSCEFYLTCELRTDYVKSRI